MLIRKEFQSGMPLTKEQFARIEEIKAAPVIVDEDCPELTDEEMKRLYLASERERKSEEITAEEAMKNFEEMRACVADLPEMTLEEINEEIRAARLERRDSRQNMRQVSGKENNE